MLLFTNKEILHYYLCLSASHFPVKGLEEMCDLITELLLLNFPLGWETTYHLNINPRSKSTHRLTL